MKTVFSYLLLFVVLLINTTVSAQNKKMESYFNRLPDIKINKSGNRSYRMTTDYYDFDLQRNFLAKKRLNGIISYKNDSAQWRDVYYAESKAFNETFSQGEKLESLQGFGYRPNEKVITSDFFKNHLPDATPLIMNLIWDALALDALAYCCWDSLTLNKEFRAQTVNSELKIADIGTFENRDIKITWIGITKINDEVCAILKYSVMNNPLKIEMENMSMSGRSHYWGEIYVSLSGRQVECANLTEDILTDVKLKGRTEPIYGYTVRTIDLSRVR